MTRDYEFRGKRVDTGKWVYGYYFESFTGISYILVCHDHILGMTEFYEVDPTTVGQYTGLKDKNGVQIYKGDIVRTFIRVYTHQDIENGIAYLVAWSTNSFRWIIKNIKGEFSFISKFDKDKFEIIGNIHDNPELLKREGK